MDSPIAKCLNAQKCGLVYKMVVVLFIIKYTILCCKAIPLLKSQFRMSYHNNKVLPLCIMVAHGASTLNVVRV